MAQLHERYDDDDDDDDDEVSYYLKYKTGFSAILLLNPRYTVVMNAFNVRLSTM